MKVTKKIIPAFIAVSLALSAGSNAAFAQKEVRSSGISLRGTYWNMNNEPTRIRVGHYENESCVSTGGGGAWVTFFSRMNENLFLELTFGAAAAVEAQKSSMFEEKVDVAAITPILLGFRQELFSPGNQSTLRPYMAFGAGPYWVSDIVTVNTNFEEEVSINTELIRGAYAGGGFNFMVSSWFGINFDMKYHFLDFNVNHELSGPEYGLGVTFMWGKYSLSN